MPQKPIFRQVESKEVSYLQLWLTYSIFSIMLIMLILMALTMSDSSLLFSISFKNLLLLITLATIIFNTIFCEIQKYYLRNSKKQYTKVLINHTGILFINHYNQTIIAKILWQDIQHRTYEKFDIDLTFTRGARSYTVYFLWNLSENNDSKIPQWSPNKFAFMFAKFRNKADLLKTLFTGIIIFRPDITINPFIYSFYRLNPISLEIDKVGIKKENKMTFLIVVFSIILSLTITLLIYLFS